MKSLEARIRKLGLEEKALANKAKNEAKKAAKEKYKAEKSSLKKADLEKLLDILTED